MLIKKIDFIVSSSARSTLPRVKKRQKAHKLIHFNVDHFACFCGSLCVRRFSANYNFAGNWSVYGTARYTRLSDEITDSPMVDKSWTGILSTGVTYRF